MGMFSLKMYTTGQFASVLLHMASIFCFLAFAAIFTFMLTPDIIGEPSGFSASAITSMLPISTLLFLQTSANMVTAQSARDIMASSSAEGPWLSPPLEVPRSITTL